MSASTGDKFTDTYNAANPNVARVTSTRAAAGSSLSCDNLAGWPTTASKVHFSTYKINTSNAVVAGTQIDWYGIVSGNTIGSLTRITGATDTGSAVGDVVVMQPTASWAHDLYSGLAVSHNNDGTMITSLPLTTPKITTSINDANGNEVIKTPATASAVNEITVTNAATGNAPSISATGGDSTAHLNLRGKGLAKTVTIGAGAATIFPYDFVLSGCVISADAAGSTKNWSITSGVVVINGNPVTVASQSANVATASKDTYVDVLDNGDGTGLLVYTSGNIVNNNAASPALASNSVRLGIIVCGASNIAAASSINQGQEDRVLPIASSIPYTVTDSLGNLICPRDSNRRVLGYRRSVTDTTTTSATAVQLTGMSVPVIVPTGRKVKVTMSAGAAFSNTASAYCAISIWDGVVASGTEVGIAAVSAPAISYNLSMNTAVVLTPSSSSKTYNLGMETSGGTFHTGGSSTTPTSLLVELV